MIYSDLIHISSPQIKAAVLTLKGSTIFVMQSSHFAASQITDRSNLIEVKLDAFLSTGQGASLEAEPSDLHLI